MSLLHRGISQSLPRFRLLRVDLAGRRYAATSTKASHSPIRTGVYATIFAVSAGLFTIYYFDARSGLHRYILMPVLRNLFDAETSHKMAVKVLRSGLSPRDPVTDDARLKFEIWGDSMSNPIGLAAGFDKEGEAVDGLYNLGFSWVEIGSVTPKPQPGNPQPRVFRLPEDDAVINRYGFPSQGHSTVLSRLLARIPTFAAGPQRAALRDGSMLAVNLGKNKSSPENSIDDYVAGVRAFGPYADVLVVNVSSPNTPGLRGLQNKDALEKLLHGVTEARKASGPSILTSRTPKLVLKIAPDLDEAQIKDIADVVRQSGIDGVIVSNTTIQRPAHLKNSAKTETGGLSGAPVKPMSLKAIRTLRSLLPASIPIIGAGGISTGADALEFAKAGAQMVQIYTSFGYNGVGTCRRIKDELVELLGKEGKTWGEVVNKALQELSYKKPEVEKEPENRPVTFDQLVSEANELKGYLDKLSEKIDNEMDAARGEQKKIDQDLKGAAEVSVL